MRKLFAGSLLRTKIWKYEFLDSMNAPNEIVVEYVIWLPWKVCQLEYSGGPSGWDLYGVFKLWANLSGPRDRAKSEAAAGTKPLFVGYIIK